MDPPPRRTAPAAPLVPLAASFEPSRAGSIWEKAKTGAATGWSSLYKVADVVGTWSNATTGKLGMEAFYPTSLELESSKAARILRTFTVDAADLPQDALIDKRKKQKVLKKIPPSAIANCEGLAIFTVFRTGLVFSGGGGSGIVIARLPDGSWSPPSGILLHTLGAGLILGADIYDVVLILRTKAAVKTFTNPRVTLGLEATVAVGPVGNGFMLEAGIEASPVWSYVKSKGLYGGVQVDGNIVIERVDENARSYHRAGIKATEVLAGDVSSPYWVEGLHETIRAAEGKSFKVSAIPVGQSPSEQYVEVAPRRLPHEEEDEADRIARQEMEEALRDFGVEDPAINAKEREADALMLSGEELEQLSLSQLAATTTEDHEEPAALVISPDLITSSSTMSSKPPKLPSRRAVPSLPPRKGPIAEPVEAVAPIEVIQVETPIEIVENPFDTKVEEPEKSAHDHVATEETTVEAASSEDVVAEETSKPEETSTVDLETASVEETNTEKKHEEKAE